MNTYIYCQHLDDGNWQRLAENSHDIASLNIYIHIKWYFLVLSHYLYIYSWIQIYIVNTWMMVIGIDSLQIVTTSPHSIDIYISIFCFVWNHYLYICSWIQIYIVYTWMMVIGIDSLKIVTTSPHSIYIYMSHNILLFLVIIYTYIHIYTWMMVIGIDSLNIVTTSPRFRRSSRTAISYSIVASCFSFFFPPANSQPTSCHFII